MEKTDATVSSLIKHCEESNDSRIHTTYNSASSKNFRVYCSGPSLQNIIKDEKVRRIFVPEACYTFVGADFSQIQLRIIAHLAEGKLRECFLRDLDIHQFVSDSLDISREDAKKVNFGICYGMTSMGLFKLLKRPHSDCIKILDNWNKVFHEVSVLRNKYIRFAKKNGYVRSPFGHIRKFTDKDNVNTMPFNSVIQMMESFIIKIAIKKINDKIKNNNISSFLVLFAHDELLYEVKSELESMFSKILKEEMESCVTLKVPLKSNVKSGDSWFSVH